MKKVGMCNRVKHTQVHMYFIDLIVRTTVYNAMRELTSLLKVMLRIHSPFQKPTFVMAVSILTACFKNTL